jgi:hypothetical protein
VDRKLPRRFEKALSKHGDFAPLYTGRTGKLAEEYRPLLKNKLAREALAKIAEKFASPEHVGPKHVADFEEISDAEERDRVRRDAYERVRAFLALLQ